MILFTMTCSFSCFFVPNNFDKSSSTNYPILMTDDTNQQVSTIYALYNIFGCSFCICRYVSCKLTRVVSRPNVIYLHNFVMDVHTNERWCILVFMFRASCLWAKSNFARGQNCPIVQSAALCLLCFFETTLCAGATFCNIRQSEFSAVIITTDCTTFIRLYKSVRQENLSTNLSIILGEQVFKTIERLYLVLLSHCKFIQIKVSYSKQLKI